MKTARVVKRLESEGCGDRVVAVVGDVVVAVDVSRANRPILTTTTTPRLQLLLISLRMDSKMIWNDRFAGFCSFERGHHHRPLMKMAL